MTHRYRTWEFIAMARLNGHERAMLTTMWFILGEKWHHA